MDFTVHTLFDLLAYAVAIVLFLTPWKRAPEKNYSVKQLLMVAGGAFLAGIAGARLSVQFETGVPGSITALAQGFAQGGKSIVGGILGGILGVKLVKRFFGAPVGENTRLSFGDETVWPIGVGLIIARIGCFLSGMADDTYGVATSLPWGWDYGDGIGRHPAQLYEIGATAVLLALIWRFRHKAKRPGIRFSWFLLGFCLVRCALEFIRIHPSPYLGLSVYQVLCLAGALWAWRGKF